MKLSVRISSIGLRSRTWEEELVECNDKLKKVSSAKIDDKLGV